MPATPANTSAALTIAVALVATGYWFAVDRARVPVLPALFMLAAGLAWLPVNKPVEGPVLLIVRLGHGLTVADLLPPAVGLGALALRGARRLGRGPSAPEPVAVATPSRPAPESRELPPPLLPAEIPATARGTIPAPRPAAEEPLVSARHRR